MKLDIHISSKTYNIDIEHAIDISIPLDFHGDQPNAYGVPNASAKAYEDGNFIGDTRQGGSCNFEEYRLIPHCNGTHTECVGHLAIERITVNSVLRKSFLPATLITIQPVSALKSEETCRHQKSEEDHLLTQVALAKALGQQPAGFLQALIIRTLPNDISKKSRKYMEKPAAYFSIEAMRFISDLKVKHLLIDTPSVDRAFDDGKLTTHHIFWKVSEGIHEIDPKNHSMNTITEMIYVPDEVEDGRYLLNLQIPNFNADAAPSRPIIYKLK